MPSGSDESPRLNVQEDALAVSVSHTREQLWHCLCHVLFQGHSHTETGHLLAESSLEVQHTSKA